MLGYQLLYLISLITFTFGALTFSVLTVLYWRERRLGLSPRGDPIFPAFTVLCAAAFLANILLRFAGEDSPAASPLSVALDLATASLPPLLLHLIYREEELGLAARRLWRWLLALFYASSLAAAALSHLSDRWADWTDTVPALRLGVLGVAGLAIEAASRRKRETVERRRRQWYAVLLCVTVLVAAANLAQAPPVWRLLPDYLVLAFFCVTLYYKERLVFFDLLIKRGAFFAVCLIGLTAFFAAVPGIWQKLPSDWSRPWFIALLLTPLWVAAPWTYRRLAEAIDRIWLRRRFTSSEAERHFAGAVQSAGTEEELRTRAVDSLSEIFQAPASASFQASDEPPASAEGMHVLLDHLGACSGWIALAPRPDSIPYLSDDRRLLQSLARTLGVVLDNVRFRAREEHLRLLAGRAELRALRAQINPHFLFNALNAIAGLIPGDPQLADETVEQLAQVFRYTLRKSEKEWVRLDEEVEFATAYLRVEQARFGARLRVDFQVDPAAAAIPIPAMSIQPLIENAIKHGVAAVEGTGSVRFSARVDSGALAIEIGDNGPGFPPGYSLAAAESNGAGHGLRNVAERLRGYYGDAAELSWQCGAEGTRVRLRIPR